MTNNVLIKNKGPYRINVFRGYTRYENILPGQEVEISHWKDENIEIKEIPKKYINEKIGWAYPDEVPEPKEADDGVTYDEEDDGA